MSYARVNWNSTTTYVSAENLNVMDKGIKDIDDAIVALSGKIGTVGSVDLQTQINSVNNNFANINFGINNAIINVATPANCPNGYEDVADVFGVNTTVFCDNISGMPKTGYFSLYITNYGVVINVFAICEDKLYTRTHYTNKAYDTGWIEH